MPPRKQAKNANQHDKRHESGLAAPGKRVTKQRSNGQLNGQPNGKPVPTVQPPALPPTGLNQGFRYSRTGDNANPVEAAAQTIVKDHAAGPDSAARDRTSSEASAIEEVAPDADMADNTQEESSTGLNVDPQATPCKPSPHARGSLATVSTILGYYPLRDAISILILLLSLPPTLVLVIQTLFASLTFVPPTAGISLSTLPNIKEMFNASNMGYPALATILIVDLIFWVCWLPVWKPVQSIFLDLSQAVIAVSLSGAAASTGGPTYSIATCTTIVCVVHVLRYKAIHLTALDYLRSVIHKLDIGIQLDVPPIATSFLSPSPVERGWIFTVIRTMIGIHIVSQGVTTCIRRSLVKANERDHNVPSITKTDPEAAAGSEPMSRSNTGMGEGAQPSASASSIDVRQPGPSPAQRDGKPRESTSKKKRKQANAVRSQQPLWAAIASTKVTFVKEMEQRDAADDAREANTMDGTTNIPFASTFHQSTDRIWISEVRDTEIFFGVDLSPESAFESVDRMEEGITVSAGLDKSKPFYVRINGAAWSSTRLVSSAIGDESAGKSGTRFDGEIFGLAPRSSYECEIVGIASGQVFCSVSLITQAARTAEQAAAAPAPPQHQALRPSSPITTLKQSIQSAEAKLNETRNRTKKSKKDQRGVHSDIRREINTLRSKLESSGGVDDKQERRLNQISQHKTQADDATAEVKAQIEAFGETPSEVVTDSEAKRRTWQTALDARVVATRDLDATKLEADHELKDLKAEIWATKAKHEKLTLRHAQRKEELEKLMTKHQVDMTARQKRDYERAQMSQMRENEDGQLRFHISNMETEIGGYHQKAQEAYQQLAALQSWSTQQDPWPGYSSPPTPEGTLPGTNGSLSPQANGFPNFASQPFHSPFHSAQPSMSNNNHGPRGRSSSMLSQYSGFTDNGDEYVFPEPRQQHTWPVHGNASGGATVMEGRKESEGSGSLTNGSTGSNSPRPDAKPFIPAAGKLIGPIAPPSKSRDKVPPSPGAAGSGR